MSSIIQVLNLTKSFGDVLAVDHVNLEIEEKHIFGFIGPNGAGKTTTIKMLTTLLQPTSGTAVIGGYDIVKQQQEVRYIIGYVPQMLSADGSLTGYENLMFFAKLYGIPREEREKRIKEVLEIMELSDSANKMVSNYSGGMIRRLEMAESILHRPLVLFLDEPTVGLDPSARHVVWAQIKKFRDYGTTVFVTTHYMDEAEALCDTLAIISRGKIVARGTASELKASVGHKSLDDVFEHYTGHVETKGEYYETKSTRRTARRLG